MIVKLADGECIRYVDCISSIVVPDIQREDDTTEKFSIIFHLKNHEDLTFPLSRGEKIYYLNNNGKTIDRDFRMCGKSLGT